MKPTQQRTEEGEKIILPSVLMEPYQDECTGRWFVEMAIQGESPTEECVEYVPASRVTALELELERAKNALRDVVTLMTGAPTVAPLTDEIVLERAQAALRDLGEGQ